MTTKRRRLPSGLQERKGRFYYETRHPRLDRGRMVVALRTEALDLAIERRQAVVTLMERGDWAVVQRIRSGDLHISDVQAAVREGKVRELRRVGHAPTILKDAVLQFLQRTEATAGSRRTYDAYRGATTVLLGHLGDDYPMQDLTVQGAEEFLHGPRKSGAVWAANTQRANRWTYSALWSLAIEREREHAERLSLEPELVRNPWKDVRVPEFRQTRVVFLEPAEWWRLVERTRGTPHMGLLTLAYRVGLRRGEAVNLRTDVDLELDGSEPVVRVQSRKGLYPWKPKTENSQRDVPLTPDAVELLQEHIAKGFAGARYFLHPLYHDRPLSLTTADAWTKEAYLAAGIRYGRQGDALTLHSGRHTYASWLAQDGVPLNVIAELLGDTLEVIYSTYAHLVPQTLRASAMRGYEKVMAAKPLPEPAP